MKKFLPITLSIFILLSITSCTKDGTKPITVDYLIFGHFYGYCLGEKCIEIYKIVPMQLLEDTNDTYPKSTTFYKATYISLSAQNYNDVKDLTLAFPQDLWDETNTVIGTPDAADGGGLYIECSQNGKRRFWLLDQAKINVPSKYHSFIDQVNAKIKLLP